MNIAAAFAWKYIILPLIIKVTQKEISDIFAQMSLADFINWIGTIKSYHEPSDFPNAPQKPLSTCNLKTNARLQVNEDYEESIDGEHIK